MKTFFRSAGLTFVFLALAGLSTATLAQNPCEDDDAIAALNAKISANYGKIETLEVALEAGKEYIRKYGECPDDKMVPWVRPQIPGWEKRVADYNEYVWRKERIGKFDDGIKNGKFDDVYSAGAELLQKYPDNVNYSLPLGLIGLYESYKNNFKYNDDSIKYAKIAIAKLKSGTAESKKDKPGIFGVYQFERNKDDAISELTYALAYINYQVKKDKKTGLAYYYEVSQMPGLYRDEPRLYATVGQYYRDESAPIGKEIGDLIEKQKIAQTDEEKAKIDVEIKEKAALFNGYKIRASEAFSRAYKFSDEKIAAEKTLKTQFGKILKDIYGTRAESDAALAALIDEDAKKLFQDPAVVVTPVAEAEPAPVVTSPSTPVPAGTKSAPGETVAANSKPTAAVKAPAAKPKASAVKPKPAARPKAPARKPKR